MFSLCNEDPINPTTDKSVIILSYNKFKGGVDTFYQISYSLYYFSIYRWPIIMF